MYVYVCSLNTILSKVESQLEESPLQRRGSKAFQVQLSSFLDCLLPHCTVLTNLILPLKAFHKLKGRCFLCSMMGVLAELKIYDFLKRCKCITFLVEH